MRSGGNTDPVAVGNRAAEAWAEADARAVMIAAASDDGQAALMGAANAFTDKGKADKARAVVDVAKLAGVGAHLSALADRVAQQSFGGSAALARTVAEEMRRGLKLDGLSIPAVVELLQTTAAGGGWTALAVLHAKLPRPGRANINRPDRILPSRLAMVDHTDRRAGRRLFTPAAHAVERGGGQLKLPGFGLERTRITPALPLALYDLGGGSSMERGRGAPLALRLWVESILAVGLTDRANPWPTVLEIPLRELLAKLYPGKRRPKPNEYWPRIMQAVEILDSTRIPWEDPETGKGGLQRIVNISSIPRGPGKLDDAVRIIVDLPPGTGKGPVVSPNLNRYGVQSAPLYRGLLNLAYQWFNPGRTRRPVRGGKHWLQVEDPERYPTKTDDLLIELFYPTSTVKNRTVLTTRARQHLAQLVKDGEARIVKGRLLPPAPRE